MLDRSGALPRSNNLSLSEVRSRHGDMVWRRRVSHPLPKSGVTHAQCYILVVRASCVIALGSVFQLLAENKPGRVCAITRKLSVSCAARCWVWLFVGGFVFAAPLNNLAQEDL